MQGSRLYVGNLSYQTTREELTALFSEFGQVNEVTVFEGKGFGFVEMGSPDEAMKAQQALNGFEYKGRPLKVDEARPQKPRQDRGRETRGGYGPRRY